MPTLSVSDAGFTVRDALRLNAVESGRPELLTPSAALERPIRWAHIIGQDAPGGLLRGGELILSTLPRLHEARTDLPGGLRRYLQDLDDVGAAALAVEVLPDRPRLLEDLHAVTAEREPGSHRGHPLPHNDGSGPLPVFLFSRVVRFVEITEAVHRELVSGQLALRAEDAHGWDPLLSATTNLLDDLAAPGGLPDNEVISRATALGIPASTVSADTEGEPAFAALVFRAAPNPGGAIGGDPLRQLTRLIRDAAAGLRFHALIGARSDTELSVLLASASPGQLCCAVQQEAAKRRSRELIPRYTVGAGHVDARERITLRESAHALENASAVAASASRLNSHPPADRAGAAPSRTPQEGFWRTSDLGLRGLLIHIAGTDGEEQEKLRWFLDHHLAPLRGKDGAELRELVLALIRTQGSKADLARELAISRPTLYGRLERLERAVGAPLTGETLAVLHTALLLEELQR